MKDREFWPTLAEEALYELPGDVVRAVDPHQSAKRRNFPSERSNIPGNWTTPKCSSPSTTA